MEAATTEAAASALPGPCALSESKPSPTTTTPLEQFVLLAKQAKGAAAVGLIKQALEAPGVYVFGELLDMPNIQELGESGPHQLYLSLLNLFAYGTYKQYLAAEKDLPQITPLQKKKLQHLTIVTLATKTKCIPYATLLQELDMNNVRELEDLIIEAVYADILHGKLDQKNSQLEVDYAIGRDIRPEDVGTIVATLQDWCDSSEAVLSCIEVQINRANAEKNKMLKHRETVEQEIVNIKKTLKSQVQDAEEGMGSDNREALAQPEKGGKKQIKSKSLRGGGKFWQKS